MRQAGIHAIRQALNNAEDNLYRARAQQHANPQWRSGNDESIAVLIVGYERHAEDLRAALTEALEAS